MKILITGGGCREPIDSVRCVTNFSTGRTSSALSDFLFQSGNEIVSVMAESSVMPKSASIKVLTFQTGSELFEIMKTELETGNYDAVIHAAAVSDFIPSTILINGETIIAGKDCKKLPSGTEMTITFKAAPKISDYIQSWIKKGANKNTKIVCFKLVSAAQKAVSETDAENAVKELFSHAQCDFIVLNDLLEITEESHPFKIYKNDGKVCAEGLSNAELAWNLESLFAEK